MTRGSSRAIWVDDSLAVPPTVHNIQVMAVQLTGLQTTGDSSCVARTVPRGSSSTAVEGQPMQRYFRDLAALKKNTFHAADVVAPKIAWAYLDCRGRLLSELGVVAVQFT